MGNPPAKKSTSPAPIKTVPAIQPSRLKRQAVFLAEKCEQPADFIFELHRLLEAYADYTRRVSQTRKTTPLIKTYGTHALVLRQILLELRPLASEKPQQCLKLCDALWDQPWLELRLLAVMLLGQIHSDSPEPILRRIQDWVSEKQDDYLIDALLNHASSHLRKTNPQPILNLVERWLLDKRLLYQRIGLRVLRILAEDTAFQDIPVLFRLIQPYILAFPQRARLEVVEALAALAHRSPTETAFLLQQSISLTENPDTTWLARQTLTELPPEIRSNLRQVLRETEKNTNPIR